MAATDKTLRSVLALDAVFAISSILLLASVIWMFAQDYYRPYKTEQRNFREVEVAVAQRLALSSLPSRDAFVKSQDAVEAARKKRDEFDEKIKDLDKEIAKLEPKRERAAADFQGIKAELDSKVSFYNIAVDHHGVDSDQAEYYRRIVVKLRADLFNAQKTRDDTVIAIRAIQYRKRQLEKPLVDAQGALKKVTDEFESQVKSAFGKRWTIYDSIRDLWVLDGFASPVKIHQYTLDDIPIDYNFKYVTRFDRCTSCHLGIDRPEYTPDMLASLSMVSPEQKKLLAYARGMLTQHRKTLAGLPELKNIPTPSNLTLTNIKLSKEKMRQFCAHPRLDLFVHSNSKHPAEKFGCTSCHRGQGSATEFSLAAHTPNTYPEMERWKKKSQHGWDQGAQHFWDFPMLSQRFVEASCIKCHHEVTDLISVDGRVEAPKVVKGYRIIRDFGCFGCHEINGRKYDRPIGPDMRLEPTPPLSDMTAAERDRLMADPNTAPGKLSKVGPSLYRISEKTNEDWATKWLRSPRSFRHDTRMPHFYGLSNNDPELKDVLPEEQKKFPDAEMRAIAHYMFVESQKYLDKVTAHQKDDKISAQKDIDLVESLTIRSPNSLSEDEKRQLEEARWRIRYRDAAPRLKPLLANYKGDTLRGRDLFSTKGCLACHSHNGTETESKEFVEKSGEKDVKRRLPAIHSDAVFGPDLSRIKAKLGKVGEPQSARLWLMNWIKNPQHHSPRTKMPRIAMTDKEIVDVTDWLLDQPAENLAKDWDKIKVADPLTLMAVNKRLADVYLERQMSAVHLKKLKDEGSLPAGFVRDLPEDERALAAGYNNDSVRYYVGKKAVARLGCYACHDIPGFDDAKSIGVALNDWGKKDPTRLAFEDILNHVEHKYKIVDSLTVTKRVKGSRKKVTLPQPFVKDNHGHVKKPYEHYFLEKLQHHDRIGFLHQKLVEPRSYDHNRIRAWDDRARMPQFRFARSRKRKGETDQEFEERHWKEEAEAREAVMTFVLGLVAEKVPLKSIYQPEGDRLKQVKGRMVIEKYNCAGCHTIQPGQYQFKLTKDTLAQLNMANTGQSEILRQDYPFFDHHAWTGGHRDGAKGTLTAFGVPLRKGEGDQFTPTFIEDPNTGKNYMYLRLTEALRFANDKGEPVDIRAGGPGQNLLLPPGDMIYPPPDVFASEKSFADFDNEQGVFGGRFAGLLTRYLIRRYPGEYKVDNYGDSNFARASVPPPLIGQGGRTQPGWLYQFLLNPHPVRKMTVLRMPRFNLSKEEAQSLVDYFTATSRLTNPRLQVTKGASDVPQRADFDSTYWKKRNEAYVEHLRNTKVKDGKQTLYEQRLEYLRPLWRRRVVEFDQQLAEAKKVYKTYSDELETARKKLANMKMKLKAEEDRLLPLVTSWQGRVKGLEQSVKEWAGDRPLRRWEESEAYIVDSFRLLTDAKNLCAKCHQIGPSVPESKEQGPPLESALSRLRPNWIKHWVARPSRLVTYPSPMIVYFPMDQTQHQHLFAGTPKEQIQAVTDALMIYDRVLAMPISRDLIFYPVIEGNKK